MGLFRKKKQVSIDATLVVNSKNEEDICETSLTKRERREASALKFDGLKAIQLGNYRFAELALENAMRINPDFETRYYYTEVLHRGGKNNEALEHSNVLLEEIPEHILALHLRAKILMHMEEYDQAIRDINKALDLTEDNDSLDRLYQLKGECAFALGQYELTLEATEKALSLNPHIARVVLTRIRAFIHLKEYDNALHLIKKYKSIFPEEERLTLYEGRIFEVLNLEDKAAVSYIKTLELDPFNEEALLFLVGIKHRTKGAQEAITIINEYIEESNPSQSVLQLYIDLLREIGDLKKADYWEKELARIESKTDQQETINLDNHLSKGLF